MLWEQLQQGIMDFLNRFIGPPPEGLSETWSMAEIIRAESTHFFFSCVSGWVVFSLILTIFSSWKPTWSDPSIFRFSLVCGVVASFTMHIFIDGFTNLV